MDRQAYTKRNEGCRLKVYRCTGGKKTFGWGHAVKPLDTVPGIITQEYADAVFEKDMAIAAAGFDRISARYGLSGIGEPRETALIDMCFQMGTQGVLGFRDTLRYLAAGDFVGAGMEVLDSHYAGDTPARARRTSYIFSFNLYPPERFWR